MGRIVSGYWLLCLLSVVLLLPACTKKVDAETRLAAEDFVRGLARSIGDLDLEAYLENFAPTCSYVIHEPDRVRRTDLESFRPQLEMGIARTELYEVDIERLEVESRAPGCLVRAFAREVVVNDLRRVEAKTTTEFHLEKTPGGFQVIAYETWITVTHVEEFQHGEYFPHLFELLGIFE